MIACRTVCVITFALKIYRLLYPLNLTQSCEEEKMKIKKQNLFFNNVFDYYNNREFRKLEY